MKILTLSLATVMAMSTFAAAETDFTTDNRFGYLGLAYSYVKATYKEYDFGSDKVDGNAVTFIAGAKGNEYFAVDVRYTITLGDLDSDYGDINGDISNIAIYAKPMYTINDIDLYGLVGYGMVTLSDDYFSDDDSESGFQWGLGANYSINDDMKIFFDYTNLYDNGGGFGNPSVGNNIKIESLTFGITHKF